MYVEAVIKMQFIELVGQFSYNWIGDKNCAFERIVTQSLEVWSVMEIWSHNCVINQLQTIEQDGQIFFSSFGD